MCRSISEGGTRCPIHRRDVMVAITIASRASGLSIPLVQQTFHQLRKQSRHQAELDTKTLSAYREDMEEHANSSEALLLEEGKHADGEPTAAIAVAIGNLRDLAVKQAEALHAICEDTASSYGLTPGAMFQEFENAYARLSSAERNPALQREYPAAPGFVTLPPAFLAALGRVAEKTEKGEAVIARHERVPNSQVITTVGYDEDGGRLEVKLEGVSTLLAYRGVSVETYKALISSSVPDAFFVDQIHAVPDYKYADAHAALVGAHTVRCGSCGQFRAATHACASRDSQLEAEMEALPALDGSPSVSKSVSEEDKGHFVENVDQTEVSGIQGKKRTDRRALNPQDVDAARIADHRSAQSSSAIVGQIVSEGSPAEVDAKLRDPMFGMKQRATAHFTHTSMKVMRGDRAFDLADRSGQALLTDAAQRFDGDMSQISVLAKMAEDGRIENVRVLSSGERAYRVKEGEDYHYYVAGVTDRIIIPDSPQENLFAVVAANIDRRVSEGDALKAVSSPRNRSQSFFMGARGDIVQGRAPKAADVRALAAQGKEVIVPVGLTVKVPSVDAHGVVYHNDGGTRVGTVSGYVGFRVGSEGLAEVSTTSRSLKCECATYQEKYYCEHVAYVTRNSRGFVQRMLPAVRGSRQLAATASPAVPEVPAVVTPIGKVPGALAARIGLKYEDSESGGYFSVSLKHPGSNVPTHETQGYDVSIVEALQGDTYLALTGKKDVSVIRAWGEIVVLSDTGPMERVSSLKAALKFGPVKMTLQRDPYARLHNAMHGHLIIDKGEDGNPFIKERHLKCECVEYAAKYDCPHVRVVTDATVKHWLDTKNTAAPRTIHEFQSVVRDVFLAGDARYEDIADAISAQRRNLAEINDTLAARKSAEDNQIRAMHLSAREKVQERWAERNDAGYSIEDISQFEKDYASAVRAKKAGKKVLAYKTSGVLDGLSDDSDQSARRFGVELEFEIDPGYQRNIALAGIAQELYEEGLTTSPYQLAYAQAAERGWDGWTFEADGSVDGEVVSPIMTDDGKSWKELQKVVRIIKKHGGRATVNAGSHINVSSHSYETSLAKHAELVRTTIEHADTLYRLASDPSRGTHRGTMYCHPNIQPVVRGDIPLGEVRGVDDYYELTGQKREITVNLGHSGDLKTGHVEYRLWDATLDEAVIQQQIKVSVALTERAEQNVLVQGKSPARSSRHRIGEGLAAERELRGSGKEGSGEDFQKQYAHAAAFIGSLFRKNEDRKGVAALFAVTKWQEKSLYDKIENDS